MLPLMVAFLLALSPRSTGIQNDIDASLRAGQMKRMDQQTVYLLSLVKSEPWRTFIWQQSGLTALQGNRPDLAISSLEQARQLGLLDNGGHMLLGEAYWAKNLQEQALKTWEPLLLSGKAPSEMYQRVILYWRSAGKLENAVEAASQWSQAQPENGTAAYILGLLSLPEHWKQAGAALEQAARLASGGSAKVKILQGAISVSGAGAPEEYRQVEIGRALGSLGEWDLALAAFSRAVSINPDYAEAWAFSSEALRQLNRDGSSDLKKALVLAPDSPVIQALAAQSYRQMGDAQQALERFQAAAKLEPQRAIWWVEIGNSYADLHDNKKGLEAFQKAASIEPLNAMIWRLLAQYCLANMLDVREAGLPAARQAALLAPDDPAGQDILGQVMIGLDDPISAERFLQQAINMEPDYPAAHLHLGQLYLRQEKPDLAQYELALAAQPGGNDAASSLMAQRLLDRYFSK
jgi:tetratricopeptide (TPR) repeat protein